MIDTDYLWLDLLALVTVLENNMEEEYEDICLECGKILEDEDYIYNECSQCGEPIDGPIDDEDWMEN